MQRIILVGFVFIFWGIVLTTLSHAASYHATLEGYYGGSCTINGEYEIINVDMTHLEYDENYRETRSCDNFSIFPSISVSGTMTFEESDSEGLDRLYGSATVTINSVPYNVDVNITYNEDEDSFSSDSSLKINGATYPVSLELIDILCNLFYE